MATLSRALNHVWTKEEEDTLIECLVELVSIGDGNLIMSHPAANGLLNKPFFYYDKLVYMFGRDRATDRFTKTFIDVGSNELTEHEGFDMSDGNEFPSVYS
ncbi:transposase [Cucumis melo var. makuwa]|uniref:Transposase n=1 Tax=Cucumis melo var. makuwa TaxID=1194695 RepID=A0A5A7TNP3_CUCMM|nr:transposase [Cucumis melo var. makuwa]